MAISTHVLDAALGRPAAGVAVTLEHLVNAVWTVVASGVTDEDGRLRELPIAGGAHRLVFQTGAYLEASDRPVFYPEVVISFLVADPEQHHHVPLLLSPFAYSTYRGS
ncbi:5-hydroxyisourate hydrolase [Crossiella equi]|uniref:5-hydroxyisourate hydrolase n=1 Tax=Crossiella equi TaxID=130796 RepID=A0ABS5ALC7_9PSEU|nr:hydroxyisourate hydrolase [Crossiella equi]MBP2477380.1 5-hydroxyisourate hydrolase [Crossiella equi]